MNPYILIHIPRKAKEIFSVTDPAVVYATSIDDAFLKYKEHAKEVKKYRELWGNLFYEPFKTCTLICEGKENSQLQLVKSHTNQIFDKNIVNVKLSSFFNDVSNLKSYEYMYWLAPQKYDIETFFNNPKFGTNFKVMKHGSFYTLTDAVRSACYKEKKENQKVFALELKSGSIIQTIEL